jgi:secreted trypsin-like serine protease
LGISVAGTVALHAQGPAPGDLVYEKLLDLSLNPSRTDEPGPPAAAPPAAASTSEAEEQFVEKSVSVRALVPDVGGGSRVVHGQEAKSGAWPTAVHMYVVKDLGGRLAAGTCGGTIIGRQWVLTAAHCAFRREEGGAKLVRAATVYAKSRLRFDPSTKFDGEVLRVKRVVVHPDFGRGQGILNDVALLELERPTTTERQKLAAKAGVDTFLAAGNSATVIGWGITAPVPIGATPDPSRFPVSKVLVQANLPIASGQACSAFLSAAIGRNVDAAEFCAGDGTGSPDTCNGDSGGPLFVSGHASEAIQAGTVSWGPGCAQPKTYGIYASVGHFEPWIRKYVPDVQFAMPREASPPLAGIGGGTPGGPPAPHGQVTVDYIAHDCNDPFAVKSLQAVNRVKVGTCVRIRVTSGVSGHLGVFSVNAQGRVDQLFPNTWSGGKQQGAAPTKVRAGEVVTIPGPSDPVTFPISEPLGRAEILAVVVPDAVPARGLTRSEELQEELAAISRQVNVKAGAPRAVGTRQYEVVR